MIRFCCISIMLVCSTVLVWAQQINADFSAKPLDRDCSSEFTFNNESSGPVESTTWHFGDGAILNDANETVTHTFSSPGSYQVILVIIDSTGGVSTDTQNIVVNNVGPQIETNTMATSACAGDCNASLSVAINHGVPPYTHSWSTGSTDSVINNVCLGTYTYTVKDAIGCLRTQSISVNFPQPINTDYEVDASSCDVADGRALAKVAGGVGPYNYQWDANANPVTDSLATGLDAGIHTLTVIDNNGCTATTQVYVPHDSVVVDLYSKPENCSKYSGAISAVVTTGEEPYSFMWSTQNNRPYSLTHLPAGNYSLTVTDAKGCMGISSITVKDICTSAPPPVAVEDWIKLYPNPTKSKVTIDYQDNKDRLQTIEVYNTLGARIITVDAGNVTELQHELNNLPSGMLIVRLLVEGEYITRKLYVTD